MCAASRYSAEQIAATTATHARASASFLWKVQVHSDDGDQQRDLVRSVSSVARRRGMCEVECCC